MKHIIILGDGMADEPIRQLNGLTPLQAAHTPNMDRLARLGRSGMLNTIPKGFTPGSEIANLSVLGYNVKKVFEGRGSLEAASMGVEIAPGEMALRCNLLTIEDQRIKNHSAGHITTPEASTLIKFLDKELKKQPELTQGMKVEFFPGVSYRHLMKITGGDKRFESTPPHDVKGELFQDHLPRVTDKHSAQTVEVLRNLTLWSQSILPDHPVNIARREEGREVANSIWPWSPGYRPSMETLQQRYGITKGSVISAVDLIKGIGVYAGLTPIDVEGATGLYNTNYNGKCLAALKALRNEDFVFLHIEASDEAGHEGDFRLKIKTIEDLDTYIVGPILDWAISCNVMTSSTSEPVAVALLPDHPTPCEMGTHTSDPVPVAIYDPTRKPDAVEKYDEFSARKGKLGKIDESKFMDLFMAKK